jgi:hypothetical protein
LKDDILLFDYNVQERVNDFVAAALAQVSSRNYYLVDIHVPLYSIVLPTHPLPEGGGGLDSGGRWEE